MLDELAVFNSKDVNGHVTQFADQTGPMCMNGNKVAISNRSANIAFCVWERFKEGINVISQALDTVFGGFFEAG